MFHYEDFTLDLEQEDRVETALIGLCYTGTKSSVGPNQPRQQGGWPGQQAFQGGPVVERDEDGKVTERDPGPIQIGLNPDWIGDNVDGGTLTGLEANPDFEVIYDSARIAKAMLDSNYLPTDIFGSPPDQDPERRATPEYEVRQAVFNALGLNDIGSGPGSHEEYREQLAEIAGVDLHGEDDSPVDVSRQQEYLDEYTRTELIDAVEVLHEDGAEAGISAKLEAAEWLAAQSSGDVRAALKGDLETISTESETSAGDADDDDDADAGGDEEAAAPVSAPFDPAEYTVPELKDRVDDVTSVAELEALLDSEADREDRTTAIDAISDRLETVREE